MSAIIQRIPDHQPIQPATTPSTIQKARKVDTAAPISKPVYTSESTIAPCTTDNPTIISRNANAFASGKPPIPPPSLTIKVSEAVELFMQAKPVEQKKNHKVEVEEEILENQAKEELAVHEQVHYDQNAAFVLDEDEVDAITNRQKKKSLISTNQKTGHDKIKELIALVCEQESNTKEELASEQEQEDAALKEQRKQDAIANAKADENLNIDLAALLAHCEQRGLHGELIAFIFREIKHSQAFGSNIKIERDQLYAALAKGNKAKKILGWIHKIAGIGSTGSTVAILAITLATGGLGGALAVIPAAAQLLGAGAKIGSDVMNLKNQHNQALLAGTQMQRELLFRKALDFLAESEKANKIEHSLAKATGQIIRNMANARSIALDQ